MIAVYVVIAVILLGLAASVRILKQYERGVQFRLGRVKDGARGPGLIFIVPLIDRVHRVSLRIVTMPIQSQGIITRDNVSVDVSAVAYYRVEDAVRSVVAIENVAAAINQIAQTTLRAVVGRHTLDETLSETETINQNIREILDVQTEEWGVKVTAVELKDIQLPESMQRAMARQAEAEREKRAKIIAAEGEALAAGELGRASDVMMAHPLALQLRNLQTMVEIGVDKNSTIVFPAPLMSTIGELGAFLSRENAAAGDRARRARLAGAVQRRPGALMNDDRRVQHDHDVRRDEYERELLALRRLERSSEAEGRLLARRLRMLGERQDRAVRELQAEYRRMHFGKSPADWPAHEPSER